MYNFLFHVSSNLNARKNYFLSFRISLSLHISWNFLHLAHHVPINSANIFWVLCSRLCFTGWEYNNEMSARSLCLAKFSFWRSLQTIYQIVIIRISLNSSYDQISLLLSLLSPSLSFFISLQCLSLFPFLLSLLLGF